MVNHHYAKWLNSYQWNYFATFRSPYKTNYMTVRNWMNQISVKHPCVYKVFYVTEWDKGDYRNSHTHSLIASYKDITYKDFNYSVSFAVGDWQSVYDNQKITSYVTKFIGCKNINYDLFEF